MQKNTRKRIVALTAGMILALGAAPAAATTMEPDTGLDIEQQDTPSESHEGSPESDHCVMAEAYYQALGSSEKYVVGPDECVVPTPWSGGITVRESAGPSWLVRVGVGVGVPLP